VHGDFFHLQRHDHIQVEIPVGMGHGFVEGDAVQRGGNVATVATPPKPRNTTALATPLNW
jgi:hypothetical protein